jgi:hypothetical protein
MRSLGVDAFGSEQFIGSNDAGDITLITKHADVSHILDQNARLANAGVGHGREMRLAASIPPSLIQKWKVEHGVDIFSADPEQKRKARELLNSNEYYRLRIWGGRI